MKKSLKKEVLKQLPKETGFFRKEKAITLIALVITIIVLLILAGITIATLTGENGVLTKASETKTETEIAQVKEMAQTDILGEQSGNNGLLTKSKFIEILNKYFEDVPTEENFPDDLTSLKLTAKEEYGGQKIDISEIWNGVFSEEKEYIEMDTSYIGYYADIDGNGTVDGIIYADLAIGGNGEWTNINGTYTIPKEEIKKQYYISSEISEVDPFQRQTRVISPVDPENEDLDRFYVMSLSDFTLNDKNRFCWYKNATGNMEDYSETTFVDFGKGKINTENMIEKWKTNEYGEQDLNDIWGDINEEVKKGGFIPSRDEWSAFVNELQLGDNWKEYGLVGIYYSSSQKDKNTVWSPVISTNRMGADEVYQLSGIRLSFTF